MRMLNRLIRVEVEIAKEILKRKIEKINIDCLFQIYRTDSTEESMIGFFNDVEKEARRQYVEKVREIRLKYS